MALDSWRADPPQVTDMGIHRMTPRFNSLRAAETPRRDALIKASGFSFAHPRDPSSAPSRATTEETYS